MLLFSGQRLRSVVAPQNGRADLADVQIPQTDWYTFTCSQERWIDLHWGFQLFAAALYHLGGINLLIPGESGP